MHRSCLKEGGKSAAEGKEYKKGVKLRDGKGFGGKGRLTDGKIDILQNYYGVAVRSNLDDVDKH